MKSITPDLMLPVERVRNSVEVSALGHLLMKCSVKYSDLRDVGQVSVACLNPTKIMWIMKRGDFNILTDTPENIFCDQDR